MKAVVTGSNRGIGLEFCKQLKEKKYEVVALCRKTSSRLSSLNVQVIEDIDVTDLTHLQALKEQIDSPIDLLINNAGIYIRDRYPTIEYENLTKQFEVNSLGPMKVTLSLFPLMKKGAKVIMITSEMGSIANVSEARSYGYRASKAALNMISKTLSLELRNQKIALGIFHPGYVETDMTDHKGHLDPQESVQRMLQLTDQLTMQNSGTFWHSDGAEIPW